MYEAFLSRKWLVTLFGEHQSGLEDDPFNMSLLPDQEQFESAVGRVRPFLLHGDKVLLAEVIAHLATFFDQLGDDEDRKTMGGIVERWQHWESESGRLLFNFDGVEMSDHDLGHAWLYGEFAHAEKKHEKAVRSYPLQGAYIAALSMYCPLMQIAVDVLKAARAAQVKGLLTMGFETMASNRLVTLASPSSHMG